MSALENGWEIELDERVHHAELGPGTMKARNATTGQARIVWDFGDKTGPIDLADLRDFDQEKADAAAEDAEALAYARHIDVLREAERIRIRDEAHALVAAERLEEAPPFDAGLLADVLARPLEPPSRVAGLIPSDAGTLIVAQRKTGKTTLTLNLARCLLTGEDFLDRFHVRRVTGTVAILNYEVSAQQLARWAHEARIDVKRLMLVNLRGRRNPLPVAEDRQHLATLLRQHQVETLIVDPFGRAFSGKSQNDPGEVGAFLADLDRFARGDAGVSDVVLTAHAGWDGERSRGSSALEDWADSIVTLVRDKQDDRVRYLRAEGRDVLVDEDQLVFDQAARTLRLAGAGSRATAQTVRRLDVLKGAVLDLLAEHGELSGNQLDRHLGDLIASGDLDATRRKGDGKNAAQLLEKALLVKWRQGPRNSHLFSLTSPTPRTSPPPPTGNPHDLPTSSFRREVGGREDVLTFDSPAPTAQGGDS